MSTLDTIIADYTAIIMSRILKIMGNHVKFTYFVFLPVSEAYISLFSPFPLNAKCKRLYTSTLYLIVFFFMQILFDNSNHDGKVPVTLNADGDVMENCAGNSTVSKEGNDMFVFESGRGQCMHVLSLLLSPFIETNTVQVSFQFQN